MLSDNEKAAMAGRLLSDPVLLEAFAAVEAEAIEVIKMSNPDQGESRENAYHRIKAIEAVLEELKSHITQRQLNERR
jgi:hypothetical protein